MSYFCQFCNEMRDETHIDVCSVCKGQLHANSKAQVCATCGRSFPLKKSRKVEPKEEKVVEFQAPEKALMTLPSE